MIAYLIGATAMLLMGLGVPDDPKNLVANPGFETVKDGKPMDWTIAAFSEGGKGTLGTSDSKPHSGQRAAHIKGDAEWATYVSKQIPVSKGKTYEVKGFLRVGDGLAYLKIDYFKNEKYLGMTMTEALDAKDWTEQTIVSELSNHPEATHITATLVGANGKFEAWFDDITVVEKP